MFLGVDSPTGRVYGATGYIVAVAYGPGQVFTVTTDGVTSTICYPFMFLATAAHVAEKLDGFDFYIRANKKDGSLAELKQDCTTRWWYHPTEKGAVDSALMMLPVEDVLELDIVPIPVTMFTSKDAIKTRDLGIGDEVFVAGLFKNAKGTAKNIPIIRIGNVAMMPGEKISFPTKERPDQELYADLLESRSIGGLSGSPVFIRETIKIDAGFRPKPGFKLNAVNSPTPEEIGLEKLVLSGVGRFSFFGSMIGHWNVYPGLGDTQEEARNMGIAPMVPSHKILEVLAQPELLYIMNKISMNIDEKQKQKEGTPVLDTSLSHPQDSRPFTKEDFEDALKKASRKITPKA